MPQPRHRHPSSAPVGGGVGADVQGAAEDTEADPAGAPGPDRSHANSPASTGAKAGRAVSSRLGPGYCA